MNFLAHCFLAQPNRQSLYGNLLGDFIKGADLMSLPKPVILGLENHREVDHFTDQHPVLPPLKKMLSPQRRRFSGLISDVAFDYFLIKHWSKFTARNLDEFVEFVYDELRLVQPIMHASMSRSMQFMFDDDGLRTNRDLAGVGRTLDRLSHRIRFKNKLAGAIEEVELNYTAYNAAFLHLFPELLSHINMKAIETV
ncbi:MAG: ACP phosphodiesterase [Arenicella sp.]